MSSSVANNGAAEPEPKRRRLLDAGGPIEDDETARQKMRDAKVYDIEVVRELVGASSDDEDDCPDYAGFDPDNVGGVNHGLLCHDGRRSS